LSSDHCIGFDYDPADNGCCNVRLTSNRELQKDIPAGFTAIDGVDGDDFENTAGSRTATCYSRPKHQYNMLKYGEGNCAPYRPQRHGYLTFSACQQACSEIESCIGFDHDPVWVYCRMRFHTSEAAASLPVSYLGNARDLHVDDGVEGPGFSGTKSSAATCYIKPDRPYSNTYDLLVYGSGNCQPNRPQWEKCGLADFRPCQQMCLKNSKCIGFDFDAENGCCRIRFSSNADVNSSSKPSGFKALVGEEGPGFSGSYGPASATCYVKPGNPSSDAYDLFIYGAGNCLPARPSWTFGNPASFGICQQTCLQSQKCMGFDYDPAFGGYCRIRFATNADATSLLSASAQDKGFVYKYGQEGYGFTSSSGQHGAEGATCYVKPGFPGAFSEQVVIGNFNSFFLMCSTMLGGIAGLTIVVKIIKRRGKSLISAPLLDTSS
jgi:hypothetical protein